MLFLISCNASPYDQQTMANEPSYLLLDTISQFLKQHPSYKTNDVTESRVMKSLDSFYIQNINLLQQIPLIFNAIEPYKKNNGEIGYLVSFKSDWTKVPYNSDIGREVSLMVIGMVDNSVADTLIQNKYYFIKGKFIKKLNNGVLTQRNLFLPNIRVKIDSLVRAF